MVYTNEEDNAKEVLAFDQREEMVSQQEERDNDRMEEHFYPAEGNVY